MNAVDFGTLYERYAADVLRFATFLTGSRSEAEDITQETFVRAWTAPGEIRTTTIKAYLFTIARRLHVDRWRDRSRQSDAPADRVDPSPGVDVAIDSKHELQRVLVALQALPEIDRAALLMRTDDELPYEDIADALGLTAGAVRVKVHRARVKLAELTAGRGET